ncbi:MAG: cbb3-type cytochrome oxidase assembly protein CcoS [Saprospiraceae bacterium]|nr:cbb3-type cytochrome oxidase assembly protein CcoS [Saprospiraceae bacterium]
MQIILFLIILSLIMAVGFLFAFFWAVKDGQYEDEYTPSIRPLIEDDMVQIKSKTK